MVENRPWLTFFSHAVLVAGVLVVAFPLYVTFDGESFKGTVNDRPEKVTSVKPGQKLSVKPTEISDWMYVDHNRKLVGGYTLRALRDSLSDAARADFDRSKSFKVE